MSSPLWAEMAEMDATFCAELLYHVEGELFQTSDVRCVHRASLSGLRHCRRRTRARWTNPMNCSLPCMSVEICAS